MKQAADRDSNPALYQPERKSETKARGTDRGPLILLDQSCPNAFKKSQNVSLEESSAFIRKILHRPSCFCVFFA
jgi:hypothetical protein